MDLLTLDKRYECKHEKIAKLSFKTFCSSQKIPLPFSRHSRQISLQFFICAKLQATFCNFGTGV